MAQANPFLKKERKHTDSSLIKERDKTDQTLVTLRHKNESQTDQLVEQLDNVTDRELMDEAISKERAVSIKEKKVFRSERQNTDEQLSTERNVSDAASYRQLSDLTTRDEFLAIVSHDLKNPIGAIQTAAEVLSEMETNQAAKDLVDLIRRNSKLALRLIEDLLDMEGMAIGKLRLHIETVDLNKVLSDCTKAFALQGKAKGVQMRFETEGNAFSAKCDRERVLQVITNLLGNALKFAPENSELHVLLKELPKHIEVSISDQGPGIPADQTLKIFDRFTQINNKKREGLGLGLYIAKMLVDAHSGNIGVESVPGKGSRFYFALPKA